MPSDSASASFSRTSTNFLPTDERTSTRHSANARTAATSTT
jgi:hypothetical protein